MRSHFRTSARKSTLALHGQVVQMAFQKILPISGLYKQVLAGLNVGMHAPYPVSGEIFSQLYALGH